MRITFAVLLILLFNPGIYSQSFSISGKVTDLNIQPLSQVNIIIVELNKGTTTDQEGMYKFENLSPGQYSLKFSYIGYAKSTSTIEITNHNITLNLTLLPEAVPTEDVIVTAGKYEQKKNELTVSSNIIEANFLQAKNISNLEDALRYVSGINMTEDQISIRGSSGYSRGAGSRVLLALDGIPFYTGDTGETIWELLPLNSTEKIEIIKGAASSLYGSTAIGGVVNVITNPISETPSTFVKAFAGFYDKPFYDEWKWSDDLRTFNGLTISHSEKLKSLSFNAAITRLESEGYKQSGFYHKYIGFAKIQYSFSPLTSIKLLFNSLNKRSGSFLYWKNSSNALVPPDDSQGERTETNRYLTALLLKTALTEKIIIETKLSYYLNIWNDNSDVMNESNSDIYRGEVQLTNFISDDFINVSGVELISSKVNSNIFGDRNSYSIGAYSQLDFNLIENLKSTAGIRYDITKIEGLSDFSSFAPKVGFNFKVTDKIFLRSSAGWGFRAPSLAEVFTSTSTSGITVKPNLNIKPESNLFIEAGVKYMPFEEWSLDGAIFNNELFDFIEPSVDPSDGLIFFNNVTRARIQGSEITSEVLLFDKKIILTFGYTYLWARDLNLNKSLKYRPRHSLISSAQYNFSNYNFGMSFRYWSRVEEIDEELKFIVQDADKRVEVFLLDLNAGFDFNRLSLPLKINFIANNLLNYNYIELIGNLQPIRNFSLSMELNF